MQVAHLIAVANLKGGCGKSTIAVNLACELAGKRPAAAVLVDADTQATATYYASKGSLPVRCDHLPLEDARERDIDRWVQQVLAIKADYVVLDAPPHVGTATKAIVGISDLVLVPCTASTADLVATVPAVELVQKARSMRTDKGPKCLLVPSRIDRRTINGREIETALEQFGEPISPAVHQRNAFVDAFTVGRWIGDYAPKSSAHEDITALAKEAKRILSHEAASRQKA